MNPYLELLFWVQTIGGDQALDIGSCDNSALN